MYSISYSWECKVYYLGEKNQEHFSFVAIYIPTGSLSSSLLLIIILKLTINLLLFHERVGYEMISYPTSENGLIVLLNSPRLDIVIEFY